MDSNSSLSLYNVRCYNARTGKQRTLQVWSSNPERAKEMVFLMDGETATVTRGDEFTSNVLRIFIRKKASTKELKEFYASMYAAIRVDESISEALRYSLLAIKSPSLKNGVLRVLDKMTVISPEEALRELDGIIPTEHLESIKAGVTSGSVVKVIKHISETVDKQSKVMRKMITATIQPGIVIVLAIVTAIVMAIVILPKIIGTLVGFGGDVPWLTQAVLSMGAFVQAYPWLTGIGVIGIIAMAFKIGKVIETKPVQFVLQRLPGIGTIFFKSSMGTAMTTMGILLEAGITTQDALKMVSQIGKHVAVKEFFLKLSRSLDAGNEFFQSISRNSDTLGSHGRSFVALIRMGQVKGTMSDVVSRLGKEYIEDVDTLTDSVEKFINPLAMLVAGGVVLVVVMALIMPIANIYTNIL